VLKVVFAGNVLSLIVLAPDRNLDQLSVLALIEPQHEGFLGPREFRAELMLAEIYKWFTEGLDTADLKHAKALLDRLNK
jgi:hypothetical protein